MGKKKRRAARDSSAAVKSPVPVAKTARGEARKSKKRAEQDKKHIAQRLAALPTEILTSILHTVGPPTRRVCHAWLAAYGPLTGGLHLDRLTSQRELASRIPRPFPQISALALSTATPKLPPATAAALPALFPALRTLTITPAITTDAPSAAINALWPLGPALQALTAPLHHNRIATAIARTLPNLRSLTLAPAAGLPTRASPTDLLSALRLLASRLPHLHTFVWSGAPFDDGLRSHHITYRAPDILPLLATFPRLATLLLTATALHAWDRASLALLTTAFPHLRAFGLTLPDLLEFDPAPAAFETDVLAAVASLQLTHLSLNFHNPPCAPLGASLSRLAQLSVNGNIETMRSDPVPMLRTLAPHAALTRLDVVEPEIFVDEVTTAAIGGLAASLVHLNLQASFTCTYADLASLGQLTKLESLRMVDADDVEDFVEGVGAAEVAATSARIAAGLTRLTLLEVQFGIDKSDEPEDCCVVGTLVRHIAQHGRLRHLTIGDATDPLLARRMLTPVADTLVRLSLNACLLHGGEQRVALPAIELLADVTPNLHYLQLLFVEEYSEDEDSSSTEDSDEDPGEPGRGHRAWYRRILRERMGSGRVPAKRKGRRVFVRLPRQLRVLEVDVRELSSRSRAALRVAAAKQDCVIRRRTVDPWYDACCGYRDGAAAECAPESREAHRRWWSVRQ